MDIQMAIPTILMAIVISSVLGPGLFNLMVAVGITYIPKFARLTRASVLSIKDQEFIEAARAMGASHARHWRASSAWPISGHSVRAASE